MQGGSFLVLCFVALHAEFAQLINKDEKDLILNENTTRVIDSLSQNSNMQVPKEAKRECQNSWNWSYRQVLGANPGSSVRASSALNH